MKNKKKLLLTTIMVALILVAVGASVYFFTQYQQAKTLLKDPKNASQQEIKALVTKVGKLITLPNETPTIATVADKAKLKDQPFFDQSENGDNVLIYVKAKKAILYRPSINKIIDVAPVNIKEQAQQDEGNVAGENTSITPAQKISPSSLPVPSINPTPTGTN